MKNLQAGIAVLAGAVWLCPTASVAQDRGTVQRLHVLDCGSLHLQDGAGVSPAAAGAPMDLSDSCYLVQTAQGYLLWETGASDRPLEQVDGDRDVFGDGSVVLLSTSGHTPGHQSLLVHLEDTGWVVLAGDAAQVEEQWDRWQASPDEYPERLAPAMKRLSDVVSEHEAQVWFSHDPAQTDALRAASPFE